VSPPGARWEATRPAHRSAWTAYTERLAGWIKWLYPGMKVKRWMLVVLLGIALVTAGIDLMILMQLSRLGDDLNALFFRLTGRFLVDPSGWSTVTYQVVIGVPTAILGLLLILYGVRNTLASVAQPLTPQTGGAIVDVIWRRRQLAQGSRIVVMGGGTGLSTMLRGLKQYTSNLTAVVTVTDDGGSSGRLQRELKMLPPGDIRNCLVALADAEPLMQELFQYRFDAGGEALRGHSFGNLLIAAMLNITGDFEEAVRQTSRVLAIRGRVLPSTLSHVHLLAELDDGSVVSGETMISGSEQPIRRMLLSDPDAEPLDETLAALETADAILIGPGSVYTSIIPNFLVKRVAEAVARSPAVKVYVCNVMTQRGETTGFSASDHVRAIEEQAGARVFDYVLMNGELPSGPLLQRYAEAGSDWVQPDVDRVRAMGYRPILGNFISQTHVVRHDSDALAQAILKLLNQRGDRSFFAGWTDGR
jgi:uncharacterized cofD-like protein